MRRLGRGKKGGSKYLQRFLTRRKERSCGVGIVGGLHQQLLCVRGVLADITMSGLNCRTRALTALP